MQETQHFHHAHLIRLSFTHVQPRLLHQTCHDHAPSAAPAPRACRTPEPTGHTPTISPVRSTLFQSPSFPSHPITQYNNPGKARNLAPFPLQMHDSRRWPHPKQTPTRNSHQLDHRLSVVLLLQRHDTVTFSGSKLYNIGVAKFFGWVSRH